MPDGAALFLPGTLPGELAQPGVLSRRGEGWMAEATVQEPSADRTETAGALALELRRLAGWLGLTEVALPGRGDLAGPLSAALTASAAGVP